MKSILQSLQSSLLTFSAKRCLLEGFIKYDFKLGDQRESLMQTCFSPMAGLFFFAVLAVFGFDPFKESWSLLNWLSPENRFVLFMLDGRENNMLIVFFAAFVTEWLIRKEGLLLLLAAFLLNRSEFHVNLATVFVLGVLLSRICYFWWASLNLKSDSRKIWHRLHQLQILAWVLVAIASLLSLDFIQTSHLFQLQGLQTRFNFLTLVLVSYFSLVQILLSVWGHFYFHRQKEPSDLLVHYSSVNFILRFKLSKDFLTQLRTSVMVQIEKHQTTYKEYQALQLERPALKTLPLVIAFEEELAHLKEALVRLERIG